MAKVRLDFHGGKGIREIMSGDAAQALTDSYAEGDAAACNAESSWGGYAWASRGDDVRARSVAWEFDGRVDEARHNRLIKNLGARS